MVHPFSISQWPSERGSGFTDKKATQAYAVELEREAEQLAGGVIQPTDKFLREPWEKHLADFQREPEARGRTGKHIALRLSRIRKVFSLTNVETLDDIRPQIPSFPWT
ncbi:hypothetical protein [Thermogutta sp.]|uniref:hypothetical protein n=1 Tax=Thermogutta sp. TaxID=1962930 RepID=UPI00321F91A6